MAYLQKNTPPVNKIYNFSYKDFSGGLNNASDQLEDNELINVLNMMFCDETLLEKRYGQEYYSEHDVSNPILHIDELKPYTDDDMLIVATEDKLYIDSVEVADISGEITGINHLNQYIFADGEKLYAYGKFPQVTDSPHVVVSGTPVDEYVLMEIVSPEDGHAMLGTSYTVGVYNYNYTDRTIVYEPCENEFGDTYQGSNVVPSGIKYIVSRKGRLYATGNSKDDDNVFISAVNNPYYYPVTMPIQIPPDSDYVVGMHLYGDGVIVGRRNDVHIVTGDTNNPLLGADMFQLKKLNTHTGFANHKAVDNVNNYLFYLGNDGNVYSLYTSKYSDNNLMTTHISDSLNLFNAPISITKDELSGASSIYFDDHWYLSVGDKVLVFSYVKQGWTMWTGLDARSFYNINGTLIWGNDDGRIAKHSEEYLDFDEPYQAFMYSKRFDMDEPSTYKHYREFFIVAHVYDEKRSDINIVYEVDYSDVRSGIKIEQKKSIWGSTVFGERFINRDIVDTIPITIGQRGRNFVFKISNGYYVSEVIASSSGLETVLGKREGLLVKTLDTNDYYLYTDYEWVQVGDDDLNQPMKIYQINGDYELRGKR